MATTTNYGWTTPDDTALVKDGASAIRTLGSSVDSTLKTQIDAQIPKTIVDAKGDLIAATASDTVARLAVGTNGQVLLADSAEATGLKWGTPASGSMTLLSTTTLTGASVTISSISQSYKSLYFVIRNFLPSLDGYSLKMRFNADSTANRHLNESFYTQYYYDTGFSFNTTSCRISPDADNAVSNGFIWVEVPDYTNTTTWKIGFTYNVSNNATATLMNSQFYLTAYNQVGAITSLDLLCDGSTFTNGTYILYGVN